MSNAIKFSPEGGTIGIRAFFQRTEPEHSEPSRDPSRDQSREHSRHNIANLLTPHFLNNTSPVSPHHTIHGHVSHLPGSGGLKPVPASGAGNPDVIHGNLIIVVTDSGPGISEVNQKKLFRSVVQFDPEKNQGGGMITLINL